MFVDFNILNQLGSPSINSNTFANRPSAGQVGRLFVSTDTFEIYRDTGTGWDLIGGPGSSTVTGSGAAGQVTYWTGTNSVGGENNLWWDAANNRFGVNTNTPTAAAEVVQTDGVALYSNFTTNAGSGTGTTALWAINNTNSSGYAAVIEEKSPNTTAGQYPLVVKHSLSSGTAGVGMGTGLHFQLPDDAGTYKTTQLTIETIDAAAATYKTRYRFMVQNNGSSTAVAYLNSTGLGLFTATPGAALDVHSTGTIAQFNTTSGTGNTYIAFQRTGTGIWRIGDTYNGGNNFFELHNTVLGVDAMEFQASTNKSTFQAQETYSTGLARGNYFDYNLSVAAGGSFSSPNAITSLGASLDLSLAGNATIPSGARSGLDAYNSIAFTGTGTLTQNQGSQLRTYANLTTGWAFNGSATGTISHLSGIHVRFPDNSGSAIAITNNYGLLINDQTPNTGTVTYTNRWGVYQEGASDLNYFAANLLLGSTVNTGEKLQVTGTAVISSSLTANNFVASGGNNTTVFNSNSATTGWVQVAMNNTTGSALLGVEGAASGTLATGTLAYATVLRNYTATDLQIATNNIVRTTITSGGNVLVGTTTFYNGNLSGSASGLNINGSIPISLLRESGTGNTFYNGIASSIIYSGSQNSIPYAFVTNDNERMRITAGGNVLIGTTTDAGQKLQVNGDIYTTGDFILTAGKTLKYSSTAYITPEDNVAGARIVTPGAFNVAVGGTTPKFTLSTAGNLEITGTLKTGVPTGGTAAEWKLGSRVAATVVVNTTEYIEVDIGGTLYKLATVT